MSGHAAGFAVIDFETTGLRPEGTDRAIEVGVVLTDAEGEILEEHETLIHVDRDLGLQERHQIRAADLLDAPAFSEVAGDLLNLLRGRVPVAHNASFDARFLDAEVHRLGADLDRHLLPWTCTMQLAKTFGLGTRSLTECCDVMGVPLTDAHRAVVDAHATAELLAAYIASTPASHVDFWQQRLEAATQAPWPALPRTGTAWLPRPEQHDQNAAPFEFLSRLVARVPDITTDESQRDYLALLDRCLLDRRLSVTEQHELYDLASEAGISEPTARALHRGYLDALVVAAWADGVITESERSDLSAVSALLDLPLPALDAPPVAVATATDGSAATPELAGRFALQPGHRICLTGKMSRERDEWERVLSAAGLVVWPSLTKKVRLLVAADPDSQSGKAQQARKYGVPVVDEQWLIEHYGA